MIKIEHCRRCDGSGHLAGNSRFEMPWTQWARSQEQVDASSGLRLFHPRICPVCEGTGTLLEFERKPAPARYGAISRHV